MRFEHNNNEVKIDLLLQKAMKAAPSTPQPSELNYTFYRKAPICAYCGQTIAVEELGTSVRDSDGNDLAAHKDCAVEVMKGVWDLLEQDNAQADGLGPYVVADLDKITPMAEPGTVRKEQPQTVHNS